MTTRDIEVCTINTIRENNIGVSVEIVKKQMLKIGNIGVTAVNEHLFEIYDLRTGLGVSTISIERDWSSVESFLEFFGNFEIFTRGIVNVRDFLLKKFADTQMQNIPCGVCIEIPVEEFEQFLLENQP